MYDLSVHLHREKTKRKIQILKDSKPEELYSCLVFMNDRIEKHGHQIIRITEESPIERLKRLGSFQTDAVLNFRIREKYDIDLTTDLPEK